MLNFVKIGTHKFLNYYIIMVSYKELGLVNTREMFAKAIKGGYAIPAFNFNNMEQMQAIVQACVETSSPVIMQVSSGARKYANPTILRYMAQGAVEYAKELGKNIPIVLHLDHGDTFELCKDCVDMGFSSVMIDGSHLPYEENIALSAGEPDEILMVGNNTREDLACCELGADGYLVTDWLLDPIDFDYRAMKHGSLEDLLDFVTALPECS